MSESKPIHILYMEDDPGLAHLFMKKMERAGYVVEVARDGEEGLAMHDADSYDVLAVDYKMPVLDGLEVIRTLAARGPLPPTIVITGTGDAKIAVEAMKLGARDYIIKDIDLGYLELLPSVIEQVLYQQRLIEEKQRAEEALRQRNRDLALLNRVGQALTATLDPQQITDQLQQAVTEIIGVEGSSVWLWDEERPGWLVCRAAFHPDLALSPVNLSLPPGQGVAGWVAQNMESAIVPHARDDPRFFPDIDAQTGFHTRSLLAVPLRVRDAVIGVLEVVNRLNGYFDTDDLALLETLAASAAIAMDNARLIETLRQQTVELQAQNDELDAFAHTVAHDLRNPLTAIIAVSDVLEEGYATIPDESLRQYLHTIARGGRRMTNIINELLLLAQVRKMEIEMRPLDMASIVAEVQQRLAYMIEEHQAEIILPSAWPVALGYGPWVEEVWTNYLTNAIKYGGQPPRVELGFDESTNQQISESAPTCRPADSMIHFWVRDNGPGITPEDQTRLFIPFTRLDQVRAQGQGLGLSIVRRIVAKLGGQVGVESKVDQGSVFTFTLPAAKI